MPGWKPCCSCLVSFIESFSFIGSNGSATSFQEYEEASYGVCGQEKKEKGTGYFLENEMPGVARGLCDGQIYHVIDRGNGKQRVFRKEGDYRAFMDLMEEGRNCTP